MNYWTDEPQTMQKTYREICEGLSPSEEEERVDPWVPLGNFLNDYFGEASLEGRAALVQDLLFSPIPETPRPAFLISNVPTTSFPDDSTTREPSDQTKELQRWAVFCAASVKFLCTQDGLAIPSWVAAYAPLAEPWFFSPMALRKTKVRERLERETPEIFRRMNIYCGDRVLLNKRAEAEKLRRILSA